MQPTYTPNMRQRPLQKSMFLPQTDQYIPRNNSIQYQYQDMMKRSSIQPELNKVSSFQFNQPQTPIHQYPPNQVLNFNHNTRYKETPRMQTQFQQLPLTQQSSNNQTTLQQLNQKVIQLTQLVESHDEIIKRNNLSLQASKPLAQTIIELQQKLKESYIPTIVSRQTKQIYEHIFNFKLEINTLREDLTLVSESFRNQMISFFNSNNANTNNEKTKSSTSLNSTEKMDRNEEPIADLTANVYSMENKLGEIQRMLSTRNDDLKAFILSEIQKIKTQPKSPLTPSKLKPSTIQSTLSPILLQYRELFVVKNPLPQSSLTRLNVSKSPRSKEQTEIVINASTYFIDKQGYLLDSQNRYIVDVKGGQIRLEEKHLVLLKQHNVLG